MGHSLMLGITSRRSLLLARVIANFAKSDRVVAASQLMELYDATAIKSSCYAGTTRLSSAISSNTVLYYRKHNAA